MGKVHLRSAVLHVDPHPQQRNDIAAVPELLPPLEVVNELLLVSCD